MRAFGSEFIVLEGMPRVQRKQHRGTDMQLFFKLLGVVYIFYWVQFFTTIILLIMPFFSTNFKKYIRIDENPF